jgi:hypothetical protein
MKAFILLINPKDRTERHKIIASLKEIFEFNEKPEHVLYYYLDFSKYPEIAQQIGEFWPFRMNFFQFRGDSLGDTPVIMAHIAIKMDCEVYQIGEPTGIEQVFVNMGIEITNMLFE